MTKEKKYFKKIDKKRLVGLTIILITTVVGVKLIVFSHAQSPYISIEAATGTLTGPAQIQSDSTASGGKSVLFGNGFITKSGTDLLLNGKKFSFIGFDTYGMNSCYSGSFWTTAQLDAYFSSLPANGMTRIFAYQKFGLSAITPIVDEATKYSQHLIISLMNDNGACDTINGATPQTQLSYYQGGWQTTWTPWMNTVVTAFKNSSTVAMWEAANEPGQSVTVDEPTMQAYLSATATAIKAIDPNHLVVTGVNNAGSMGGGETNYENAQSSPNIDVLSIHDYAWDFQNKAVESNQYKIAQTASTNLKKPFIVGEAGVESGASCTADLSLSQRVSYLQSKTDNYFKGIAGDGSIGLPMAGIMYFDYEPIDAHNTPCAHEIFPGDPLIQMVHNYPLP